MRIILGLAAPTSGTALAGAVVTSRSSARSGRVGSLLDATAVHGAGTAYDHLPSVALWRANSGGRRSPVVTMRPRPGRA